jgi:hypothetical protein
MHITCLTIFWNSSVIALNDFLSSLEAARNICGYKLMIIHVNMDQDLQRNLFRIKQYD